ncbi:hypothetical protein F8M41_023712 [Gigaspora margarita]|uniref:Uncharacterized protein n=1 Tax=Gigaspora margarita TaxID=4874 RepID=A0A8H4B0P6_GIGMA|nr:hypothetical protein F8M41_023712 [Gigaspora margarita]
MSNQNEHTSVEMENKENAPEVKYESVIEEDCPEGTDKYFAISTEGDFLVEFKIVNLDSLKFELKMYDIKNLNNEDGITLEKDLKPENDQTEMSKNYRIGSFPVFTTIPNCHLLKRSPTEIQNIQNNEFIFIFIIYNDYSIDNTEDKDLLIKYGGIVKLFYEKDYIADKNADVHFLIILTLSGIYKGESILWEFPSYYAISSNNKLLAYFSFPIKGITIYSIECGLEVAELANILNINIFKPVVAYEIFLYFFQNDEKLLIYFSESNYLSADWAVWDIFSLLRDFVKSNYQNFILELPSIDDCVDRIGYVEKSNSCIVIYQRDRNHDKIVIYDDLGSLPKEDYIQYLFFLDEKKEKLLIIGYHTVQVWYGETLKFIHSPIPFFDVPDYSEIGPSWRPKKIEIISIKYFNEKFKFNIKVKDAEGIKQIIMNGEYDINVVKNACCALEYFSVYMRKFEQAYDKMEKLNFDNFIKQTRKIILKFIRLHPTE